MRVRSWESTNRNNRWVPRRRMLSGAAAMAALIGVAPGVAAAAPGDTSAGSTVANVQVASAIALTGLTPNFTLTGLPGETISATSAVGFVVTTNNIAGYAVTVESVTPTLVPATGTNPESIPIGTLTVRETGGGAFAPLSDTAPVTVHSQDTRSAQGGDTLTDDYQLTIPFVNQDTYSAVLNYIATAL